MSIFSLILYALGVSKSYAYKLVRKLNDEMEALGYITVRGRVDGMMRRTYLEEHRKSLYLGLVLAGRLNEHLHQIDEECHQMMDRLVEQMKEQQGVTKELKMQDQMAWVGRMNNIRACAEEVVLKEFVFG